MKALKYLSKFGKKYKTGIILSGGGARGFAHAGILKALNEAGIYPDVISAVSAGAIVGAFYADGYTPDEIFEIFSQDNSFFNYVKITLPKTGLFKAKGLKENISGHLRAKTFEALKIPLYVAASNMNKGKIVYFNSGEIANKVLASAAIPVLFQPVEINGEYFVDGGVLDNFPVSPIAGDCRKMIGISLNPINTEDEFKNLVQITERTFRLSTSSSMEQKQAICDLVFEPDELAEYGLLDLSKNQEMYELGYHHASKILNLK